ncbi:MAG TPA: hypothetical protein VN920_07705 [Pyrinomonadaceae bacterium]|nr:hypothetical protein [Pyrinomonadaceae bacterium]
MKIVNRKMFLSLLGIAVATPFLVIALVLGARATALADSLQGDLLVVVLALASLVASIGEGRLVLKREVVPARRGSVETNGESDRRGASQFHHGY